ncbi:MAG: type I glyceraldehyde-3-phosphate dehydrogenase [Candidatus Peregrinibacteria bacterium]|nr:type I glyceraldehyde-3-phosphate dehydrogenase [Candidatus Peregrinibacteria bacterium]
MLKVAINGFGRIGRQIFHINSEKKYFEVVAINDLTDSKTLAHLLKYDSNYGIAKQEISATESEIIIDGKAVKIFKEMDPERLPWKDLGIDLVIESTGAFTKKEGAEKHLKAGSKKVIVTAPGTDLDLTIVLGVNENEYDSSKHNLVSNASCTTNCLAPVAKIINDNFGIVKGSMTTIHSYTNDQRILDLPHKDLRRARSAGQSIIPTTTGAAKAIGLVIPELAGKLNGISIRVPTPTVSIVDLVCEIKKETTVEEVNAALKKAAETSMKDVLGYTELPLVSIDFRKNPLSSIVDGLSTQVVEKNLVKVLSWYDNEWGYSNRVVDLVKFMGEKM